LGCFIDRESPRLIFGDLLWEERLFRIPTGRLLAMCPAGRLLLEVELRTRLGQANDMVELEIAIQLGGLFGTQRTGLLALKQFAYKALILV
jgi:hypothetical protein